MPLFLSTLCRLPSLAVRLGITDPKDWYRAETGNSCKVICTTGFPGAGHLSAALSPRSHSQESAACVSLSHLAAWHPEPYLS